MLYEVRFRCNHVHTMDLTGQAEDRFRKIALYNQMFCPEFRAQYAISHTRELPLFRAFVMPARQMQ